MRTLTKEAERKLISAIERAASLVNDGAEPNAAIIKSASEADIPAGHINLMVHAYNTGRTTKQREQGDSTLEKAADFKLADADTVLKALYPEQVKTSAEIRRNDVVSTEYAVPPTGFLNRRRDLMQKAASAAVPLPEKTWTPPPRDERAAVMRAQSEKNAALRAAEETRRQAAAAYQKAANSFEELNTYFRTPGNMSFGDALREVGLRLGPSGVSVLQKIAAVYPHFAKQAATSRNYFGSDPLYQIVEDVIGTVERYNEAQSRVVTKKADAGFCKKETPEFITGSILHDPAEQPLELKSAWDIKHKRDRNPADASDPYTGRASFSSDDKDLGAQPRPRLPAPPPAPAPSGDDMPLFNSVMDDIAQREEDDEFQKFIDRQKKDVMAGKAEKARREAREFEDAIRQKELDRERKIKQDEEDRLTELEFADKWRAGREELKKQKEDTFNKRFDKGKAISDLIGGAGPSGGFLANATKNITRGAELMGAKSVGDMAQQTLGLNKDPAKQVREEYLKLTDPTHENALKTIRAKGVLHDMILNDPVVSGYDPQDVAMAFNEIAELAPSLIDTPGMIRPLLRKRLEAGQLADFDVKQIIEMDKLRADRDKALIDTKEKTLGLL